MKLVSFKVNGEAHLGEWNEVGVLDLTQASRSAGQAEITLESYFASPRQTAEAIMALSKRLLLDMTPTRLLNPQALAYLPPVPRHPEKIICVGLNYRRHAEETGAPIPTSPILFSKFNNALAAHGESVPLPATAEQYDYEAELGVVIGKTARDVRVEDALHYVGGYLCANDLSARDLQLRTSQWLLGKSLDKFAPLGPWLVTPDEIPNPQALRIQCWVNGEQRQDSNTSDMVFSVAEVISYASQYMTLKAGDILLTGTPEGVVLGMKGEKHWLKAGDVVEVAIEGLGRLKNLMA